VSNDNNDPFEFDDIELPEPMDDAPLGDDAFGEPVGEPLGEAEFDSPLEGSDPLAPDLNFDPPGDEDAPSKGKKGKAKSKSKGKAKTKKAKKPAAKKKSKSSKSQKPAKADDVNGGIPILATCGLMLLGLVGLNFYVFTSFSESATAFFYVLLVVMNILGLIAVSVPYFCWTVRGTINIYEVCLGLAVIALVIGSAALIIELARYGGDIDPSASIPVEQSNDIYLV
jgi:hypothetical protein